MEEKEDEKKIRKKGKLKCLIANHLKVERIGKRRILYDLMLT